MSKLTFCDYHNMVAILEKTENNTNFHQIVDFLEASPLRIETADEETYIIAKINGEQVTVSESSIRRKLKLKDEEGISDLPDTDLFENLSRMGYNILPNQRFSNIATAIVCLATNRVDNFSKMIFDGMITNIKRKGSKKFLMYPRNVGLFESMLVPQGKGPVNPTEPHHTPSPPNVSPLQIEQAFSPPQSQPSSPQQIHPLPSPAIQTTRQIAQSKALTPRADEHASPLRDDSYGEAFPTATSLDAGHARENIPKTSAMPHEPSPRVTSLDGGEDNLEISQLKGRIMTLEDAQNNREGVQEDAPNRGGIMHQREEFGIEKDSNKSTDKRSESTGEMGNVLSSIGAANILASGGLKEVVTLASPQIAPATLQVSPASATDALAVATASIRTPTAVTYVTTRPATTYTRRARVSRGVVIESSQPSHTTSAPTFSTKGKEKMTEPKKPRKKRVARDTEIARIQAEEDLRQMIDELDRSNEVVNKHMAEYEKAKHDLSLKEKIDLIRVLLNYQKNLAQVKKYQAQQQRLGSKTERRKFYMSDFVSMDSKLESERVKRPGILLQQESSKRIKTVEASETEPSQEQQAKDPKDLSKEELKKMMEIVPVEEITRVGNYTEIHQTLEDMVKKLDREDLDKLWSFVKEAFISGEPIEDKAKELWKLYDTCGVHHVFTGRGQEIFMLVEKDYPLTKGLATVILYNKLQVDQYSEMANALMCTLPTHGMKSIISTVSISPEGFRPSILLLVVIIVMVVIVVVMVILVVVVVVVVVVIIGVVIIVMIIRHRALLPDTLTSGLCMRAILIGQEPFQFSLGYLVGLLYSNRFGIGIPPG
ncbi:hypothetical protein Tco_0797049 [Tanacetum coccineum]